MTYHNYDIMTYDHSKGVAFEKKEFEHVNFFFPSRIKTLIALYTHTHTHTHTSCM